MDRRTFVAIGLLGLSVPAFAQAPPPRPRRIRGRIAGLEGQTLKVKTREGEDVDIRLAENVTVSALRRLELSAIAPNSYVGVASKPGPDGDFEALEVLVFPEAMRGTGEGHFSWDLQPGSMMTNATVEASVAGTNGRDLNLVFQGRAVKIRVPPQAPIVTFIPAARSDLVAGAQVFLSATPDMQGGLVAARITVEKDGVPPPM